MTFESAPAQPPAAAVESIEAMPALRAAWGDPSAERCLLLAGGGWLIQRRGQLQRQPEPLPARASGALLQALASYQRAVIIHGWRIEWSDGEGGGLAWMERVKPSQEQDWDGEACGLLLQAMRRGARGAVFGSPWSMHDQLLSWIAAHHHAAHLFYVCDDLPQPLHEERVFHLYPPADGAARRKLARLLDGAPAVFWERVDSVDALRVALGPAGAQSRWLSLNALDPVAGAAALLDACDDERLPPPELLAFVERGASGSPAITQLQVLEAGQWKRIFGADQPALQQTLGQRAASAPVSAAPARYEPSVSQTSSLRTSAEIALRELGVSPGEASYQPAASTINELFEDSEEEAALIRESGELTAQAALKAQSDEEPSDPDSTSELAAPQPPERSTRFNTPLFGSRLIARATSSPALSTEEVLAAPEPAAEPEPSSALSADDDPATRELDDLDLEEPAPPPSDSAPSLDIPAAAQRRVRETLDESPPSLAPNRPTLQIDGDAKLARVSGEDFVLEEYLQQRATREASAHDRAEVDALKVASLVDVGEQDDAVTGNVPGKLLQHLLPQLSERAQPEIAALPEMTSTEQPALDAIGDLDELYDLDLPPARIETLGTEPSLRAFQSIPQSDVFAMTSPAIQTPGELSWSEDEDTQHRQVDEEDLAITDPHKRSLPAEAAPPSADEAQSRRSALSQRLRALSQQRQQRGDASDDAAPQPQGDQTRQQSVSKEDLLWRLRQQLQDDE